MVIPARKRVGSTAAKEKIKKLRVAAYCRVSTETEEQNSSYEVEVAHYTEFMKKNTEWEFAGICADDGISVFFEKENINTMDTKGEVLLTIMASLAQQESQSLSQSVKLGLQFRYQQGKAQV